MKEKILRVTGSICIIVSVFIMFLTSIISIGGVTKRDLREYRKYVVEDLNEVEDYLLANFDYIKEDLKENELPFTKTALRKAFNKAEHMVKTLIDSRVSVKELISYAVKIPSIINNSSKLLETDYTYDKIMNTTNNVERDEFAALIDEGATVKIVASLVIVFFVLLIIFSLFTGVFNIINRMNFAKYILFGIFLIMSIALMIGVPIISEMISESEVLPKVIEDLTLHATGIPFVATSMAAVPIIIDIVCKVKSKRKGELKNEITE